MLQLITGQFSVSVNYVMKFTTVMYKQSIILFYWDKKQTLSTTDGET